MTQVYLYSRRSHCNRVGSAGIARRPVAKGNQAITTGRR